MRRRLFTSAPAAEADVRPTLLGVVTLLFLLLFFLLATSSGQRLGTVTLRFGGASDLAPLPHAGLVQELRVAIGPDAIDVTAQVSTTDIAASATSTETRRWSLPPTDLSQLDAVLVELHDLDPAQERAVVAPGDAVSTEVLLTVLDLVRGSENAPRFPQVALEGTAP